MSDPINWRAHISYPDRVWERHGQDVNGNDLWVSRPATPADWAERIKNARELMNPPYIKRELSKVTR